MCESSVSVGQKVKNAHLPNELEQNTLEGKELLLSPCGSSKNEPQAGYWQFQKAALVPTRSRSKYTEWQNTVTETEGAEHEDIDVIHIKNIYKI